MTRKPQSAVYELFRLMPELVSACSCPEAKKKSGLTFTQIRAIISLAAEKKSLKNVAKERGVSPASASVLITSLEKKGLVDRETDKIDSRRTLIGLTPEGRKCYEDFRAIGETKLSILVESLTQEEAQTLAALLSKL